MAGYDDEFDPRKYDTETRLHYLESKVAYLLDEVSSLRSIVRDLTDAHLKDAPDAVVTRASFDFQWRALPEGRSMLSNPDWKARVPQQICEFANLPAEWFGGKTVMDAGCGQGRWTYGFGQLGVARCVSFDISEAGLARTACIAKEFGDSFQVVRKDVRQDLGFGPEFDLVWCFGVLHHTGGTHTGFKNIAKCVKPGGYMFVMLYGEPRAGYADDYRYYHEMFSMRNILRNIPFDDKVAVLRDRYGDELLHGYFDAISPEINDLYRWDEIVSWFYEEGFESVMRTDPGANHHVVARKKL
jgi:SAM-dependent methyltransferase